MKMKKEREQSERMASPEAKEGHYDLAPCFSLFAVSYAHPSLPSPFSLQSRELSQHWLKSVVYSISLRIFFLSSASEGFPCLFF